MRQKTKVSFAFALAVLAPLLCNGFSFSSSSYHRTAASITSTSSHPPSTIRLSRSHFATPSTALFDSSISTNGGGVSSYDKIDWSALVKYPVGLAVQMALMFGFLTGVDKTVAHFSLKIPLAVNFLFLYAFNLKSSLFSIFPQKKSDGRKMKQENWEYNKRNKPSWTPPGLAFVFGWPLLTFGLRAFTGAMVVKSIGSYANPAIMSLMLHLGIGNLWNTVYVHLYLQFFLLKLNTHDSPDCTKIIRNNVERRLGVSVILLYSLWLSKAFAAFQFFKVEPLAGKLLALTLTWISAACALETRTWQINPDPDTGKREPLLPMQHPKWSTKFKWEQ